MKTPRGAEKKLPLQGSPAKLARAIDAIFRAWNGYGFAISRRGSPKGVRAAPDFATMLSSLRTQGPIRCGCCCWKRRVNDDLIKQSRPVVMGPCVRSDDGRVFGFHFKEPTHLRDLAARFRPRFAVELPALENRGRREDRVRAAPAVSRAIAHRERAHEHTGSAEAFRPSLRSGLTVYFVLSPENGSLASVACGYHRKLDASTAASGPHDFAVRLMRVRLAHSASTASHRAFVTIASRPS